MTPVFLLDTNTVSYFVSGKPPEVRTQMNRVGLAATAISAITEGELRYGLANKQGGEARRDAVEAFLANASILPWDSPVARTYGELRAEQRRKGRPLSVEDMMIAAHALALDLTLVTHDGAFSFVEGLRTVDWTVA